MKINLSLATAFAVTLALPAQAQEMDPNMPGMDHAGMDHSGHDMTSMPGMKPDQMQPGSGSGTSRLPANEGGHHGMHFDTGGWMLMAHGYLTGVYTNQSGPRGDDKFYAQSMFMLTGERSLGDGATLQLRSMLSLEPLMKHHGYPSLFATGETAGGNPLIDRQHPHDLFMELSAQVDVDISDGAKLFLYGGPVGEPALGPSAFMHRRSAKYNPEAPITHHWFDSTHISYGVLTGGFATRTLQIEASAFRGREPDERRFNIETPRLDSWSVRATWNPSPRWALQASHGSLKEPEELEPGINEHRTTASVHYASGGVSAMIAFSAKNRDPGRTLTAWLAEANWDISKHHTVFARVENVCNDELFPNNLDPLHDTPFRVSKFQAGYAWNTPLAESPLNLALGASVSTFAKPDALNAAYGRHPMGHTLFAKLSLGH